MLVYYERLLASCLVIITAVYISMHTRAQGYEEENQGLVGQVSLLEDQLKMASVASRRKLTDAQKKQSQFGSKLEELLQLHRDIETHLKV